MITLNTFTPGVLATVITWWHPPDWAVGRMGHLDPFVFRVTWCDIGKCIYWNIIHICIPSWHDVSLGTSRRSLHPLSQPQPVDYNGIILKLTYRWACWLLGDFTFTFTQWVQSGINIWLISFKDRQVESCQERALQTSIDVCCAAKPLFVRYLLLPRKHPIPGKCTCQLSLLIHINFDTWCRLLANN